MATPRSRRPPRHRCAVLLTPGAGSGRDHPSLVATEEAMRPHGVAVARMDFPYRKAGRRAPDRLPVLVAAVVEGAAELAATADVPPGAIVVGGRSLGGRVCSVAVSQGLAARAVVLVSYPLHPPGRPDRLRVEHLPALEVPCLFVSGTRDAFARPDELQEAVAAIPGPVTHVWIEGGDHGLRRRDAEVADAVRDWVLTVC
ncbi:MAG TPA: alpha/beta family hydrolase [Acidimicrobiales bacterium]|nr:alpha/beta family hydrolase [Acidimicrobiales bacterium]